MSEFDSSVDQPESVQAVPETDSSLAEEAFGTAPRRVLQDVVIVDAVRTPFGLNSKDSGPKAALRALALGASRQKAMKVLKGEVPHGALENVTPTDLAAESLKALVDRIGDKLDPKDIEDVVLGCATQGPGQGVNLARNAVLTTDLPDEVGGVTVNRLCGSGLQAVNQAYHAIACGEMDVMIAGGIEHMNAVPILSDFDAEQIPENYRVPKNHNQMLGAQLIAQEFGISREVLDQFSLESQQKYAKALKEGKYDRSIVPIDFESEKTGHVKLDRDEHPRETTYERLARLKPVAQKQIGNDTITAGMSSGIVDGASTVLLMNANKALELSLTPRARIVATATIGSDPMPMLTGPIASSRKALDLAGLEVDDIDRWEINEAFAPVVVATMQELGIEPDRVNVWGGAIAHGHPLGATGAALLGKVIDQLEDEGLRYGAVTLCIGMGQGITTIVERISNENN